MDSRTPTTPHQLRDTSSPLRRGRLRVGGKRGTAAAVAAVLFPAAGLVALAAPAVHADGPCTTSGNTVTCTYSYTGAEQTFTPPPGVSSIIVTATGARGGGNTPDYNYAVAGAGATVSNAILTVTPGQPLYIAVGGAGGHGSPLDTAGFNGGGAVFGFGGGGATSLQTCSISDSACTARYGIGMGDGTGNAPNDDPRLVVAGGGGGAAIPLGGGDVSDGGKGLYGDRCISRSWKST